MEKLAFTAFIVLLLIPPVLAEPEVWACDASGKVKELFYTNDTVYACGRNLTAGTAAYVDIYIVNDTSSWQENKTLSDVSIGYQSFLTNATGDLPATARWSLPKVGSYDMVADVDGDGRYNSSIDYVDSITAVGFTVTLQPKPTLNFALGPYSPGAHGWDLTNETDNIMMQLKVTAYENEDIVLNWIGLTASGSGDDRIGVKYVKLVKDVDGDGVINSTDPLLAYNYYMRDNGITMLTIEGGERILLGNTTYFIIAYVMSPTAELGDTFKFQVTAANAVGANTATDARITGLPLDSPITSISVVATTTTTTTILQRTTTTTILQTTTIPTTTTTTTIPPTPGLNYPLIIAILAVVLVLIIAVVYYTLFRRKGYNYEELKKKWR